MFACLVLREAAPFDGDGTASLGEEDAAFLGSSLPKD